MDVIDMESYKSGYKAGEGAGFDQGYEACRIAYKKRIRRLKRKRREARDRKLYFLKQKLCGLTLVILPIAGGFIFEWYVATIGVITVPIGLFFMVSNQMWLVNDYMRECEEKEGK